MCARVCLQSKALPTELLLHVVDFYFHVVDFSFHELHNWSNAFHLVLCSSVGNFNAQNKL